MKKRIVCVLLTIMMLVSLVPATLTASAASNRTTSETAIKIIKEFEGFRKDAYWDNSQWSIGYGTVSVEGATISETGADQALRAELASVDKAINSFAAARNLNFSQNQHDALASFSYNCGTAWMNASGRFRQSILNGDTGNTFLTNICLWSNDGGVPSTGLLKRRLAEANMYLNGNYSKNPPSNYTYVILDANGGSSGEDKMQGYNTNVPAALTVVPTREGHRFMGWYTAAEGGQWVTVLDGTVAGKTLYAHWQAENAGAVTASYNISAAQLSSLNVYETYDASSKVIKTVAATDTLTVAAEYIDSGNVKWVNLSSGGWASLGDVEKPIVLLTNVVVTVTSNYLNIRASAGAAGTIPVVAKANCGDKLTITEVTTVGSGKWGRCEKGWVALMYTDYDMVLQKGEVEGMPVITSATVNCSTTVNVRQSAGTTSPIVGKLKNGDKVNIYDITQVAGHQWGRIEGGWFCLDYAILSSDILGSTGEGEEKPDEDTSPDTSAPVENVIYHGTVVHDYVNIRAGASAAEGYLGRLTRGDQIDIYEITTVNGRKWGRFSKGWVCLDYVTVTEATQGGTENGTAGENNNNNNNNSSSENGNTITAGTLYIGIVSNDYVNIRQGAGAANKYLGKLTRGDRIEILEIQTVYGHKWGRFSEGWVCLDYVTLSDAVVNDTPGTTTPESGTNSKPEGDTGVTEPLPEGAMTGTVSGTDALNIRKAPGTKNAKVGKLTRGTKVTVYEQTNVDNAAWGRIGENQWVAMKYITLDAVNSGNSGTAGDTTTGGTNNGTTDTVVPGLPNSGGIYATGFVSSTSDLTVRSGPGPAYNKVGALAPGDEVTIYEQQLNGGMIWGRIGDDRWVCQSYVTLLSTGTNGTGVMGTVVRTGYAVNVRSAPGTGNALLGKILVGARVEIYEQVPYGGTYWGRVNQGWISMDYVLLDSDLPEGGIPGLEDNTGNPLGGTVTPVTPAAPTTPSVNSGSTASGEVKYTGKVILTNTLRVRANASTGSTELGKLKLGEAVNIYETTISESMAWGKCDSGWICLTYVDLQSTQSGAVDARVIWKESLTIRAGAGNDYDIAGTYAKGAVVDIYEFSGNWARTADGWVNVNYLLG